MQSCVGAGHRLQQGLLSVTWLPLRPGLQESAAERSMHHAAKQCARWQVCFISSSKPLRC